MGYIVEDNPELAHKYEEIESQYEQKRHIDEKTYQLVGLALAIKGKSPERANKHFVGAGIAGATIEEIFNVIALAERESKGEDY